MRTKEAAIKDMKKTVVHGTSGFLFQYHHNGWDWCTEKSPKGEQVQSTLSLGSSVGTFVTSQGAPVAGFFNAERVTA